MLERSVPGFKTRKEVLMNGTYAVSRSGRARSENNTIHFVVEVGGRNDTIADVTILILVTKYMVETIGPRKGCVPKDFGGPEVP